jgi:prepilin-type processing-associated H-X9-DG protein
LKQIGLGILQYNQDYDEGFPLRDAPTGTWRQIIQPYVKSTDLFRCPSNQDNNAVADNAVGSYPEIKRSYGMNHRAASGSWAVRLTGVEAPSTKILVSESKVGFTEVIGMGWTSAEISYYTFAGHLTTMNCLFFDGHVKALRPQVTAAPINMWGKQLNASTTSCLDDPNAWINCDTPEKTIVDGMALVQANYP